MVLPYLVLNVYCNSKGFEPDKSVVKVSQNLTDIELTTDPLKAAKNADVVVTDTYSSIHNNDPKRMKKFLPKYQVNDKLMGLQRKMRSFYIVFLQNENKKLHHL